MEVSIGFIRSEDNLILYQVSLSDPDAFGEPQVVNLIVKSLPDVVRLIVPILEHSHPDQLRAN
jgi:hypothetical protein